MKVSISVIGRFHAFNMAQQFLKRHALAQLITTYPAFEVARWNIPLDHVTTFPLHEAMTRLWRHLPRSIRHDYNPGHLFTSAHDRFARQHLLPGADLFIGWAGMSLGTIRRARDLGMLTVVERGSSHILYQTQVMVEEMHRLGRAYTDTHPKLIQSELTEYAEADFIAIPSLYVKRSFLQQGIPESKLIHVPYGTDLSQFHPEPRQDDLFRIIHCGGITIRKGVHYLLQAFSELKLPKAELWLVGSVSPELQPFLEKYASNNIRLLGHQPQSQLRNFYSQACVFCLASIEEGLAMVIPQAMACGLPVICTTNTGGEDIVRHAQDGFVIPIRDVEALKEKILWCYEHPSETRAMGASALQRVRGGFSWDDYGRRLMEKYEPLVAAAKAKP